MSYVISVLSAVFWGLLLLSMLVFVHEAGHYLAARALGVRVTEFFLGLPCRIKLSFTSKRVGTEFGVTPVLIGGYNRICGMEYGNDELLPEVFKRITEAGRISVDELEEVYHIDQDRAYEILLALYDRGSVCPYYNPDLGEYPTQKEYPRVFETLERDNNFLCKYDKHHDFSTPGTTEAAHPRQVSESAEDLYRREVAHSYAGIGFWKRILILFAGPAVNLLLAFVLVVTALMARGADYYLNISTLGSIAEGSYAEAAGLEPGDQIIFVGSTEVSSWTDLVSALDPYLSAGEDFTIELIRDGEDMSVDIDLDDGVPAEYLGITASLYTYRPSLSEASAAALSYATEVASYVVQLIIPSHTMEILEQSSSVVGIAAMASEAASSGLYDFVILAAAISMSLGFMNLLPIPPLDGGKILIEIIQVLIRRPLSMRVQNALTFVGLAFFLFVLVFVVRNDIVSLMAS